jgi:hypothetical protein
MCTVEERKYIISAFQTNFATEPFFLGIQKNIFSNTQAILVTYLFFLLLCRHFIFDGLVLLLARVLGVSGQQMGWSSLQEK